MEKKKVLVIFGGMSTEHDISRNSATSILQNINKEKYEIGMIGIDKSGEFLEYTGTPDEIGKNDWKKYTQKINNVFEFLRGFDVAFPVLHGLYGEDGTIQGLFELLKLPYVGCKVLASSLAMDKVYTKIVFDKAGIKQVPSIYLKVNKQGNIVMINDAFNEILEINTIVSELEEKLGYPMFIKPSNSGSSIGVSKAKCKEELMNSINEAKKFDTKILVEKGINCREVECAILEEKGEIKASVLGEILPAREFYSYESKYQDENSGLLIPANLSNEKAEYIREIAIKAFKSVDGTGFSRVDFFVDKDTNEIYLNEINTIPGFTKISMYPKLCEKSGIDYSKLIDILIENAK